jgi:hypothetical protein
VMMVGLWWCDCRVVVGCRRDFRTLSEELLVAFVVVLCCGSVEWLFAVGSMLAVDVRRKPFLVVSWVRWKVWVCCSSLEVLLVAESVGKVDRVVLWC